jgi:hypothetical protein
VRNEEGGEIVREFGDGLLNGGARRRDRRLAPGVVGICLVMIVASSLAFTLAPGARASSTPLGSTTAKVPCGGSIQNAINAAPPGGTIVLGPCTYVQQLTIDKSVNIVGAGAGKTTIQSPAVLIPDVYGNLWTIELGNAASVTVSGVMVLVTLQCLMVNPATGVPYASGGIGVGGSAALNLESAVITTTGMPEGAACSGGISTYGTGVDFGLDYVVGTPPASALLGYGEVSQVTVSGFGFSGPGIEIGGLADAPAGSNAVVSQSGIFLSANANPGLAAILVGGGGNANTATIDHDFVDGQAATYSDSIASVAGTVTVTHSTIWGAPGGCAVCAAFSGFAEVQYNSILPGPGGSGLFAGYGGSLVALHNLIVGSTSAYSLPGLVISSGVLLVFAASATVSDNTLGQFECEYNPTYVSEGLCGPDWATQAQAAGIYNFAASPGPFIETNNLIYSSDVGVLSYYGCSECVVSGNVVINPLDYGLDGIDGSYSFGPDLIIGGAYGVGAVAYSVDTTVTLSHVVLEGQSVAPYYDEIDFSGGTATVVGT